MCTTWRKNGNCCEKDGAETAGGKGLEILSEENECC